MFPREPIEAMVQHMKSGAAGMCSIQPVRAQRGSCIADVTVASVDSQCLDGLNPGSLMNKACGDTETPAVVSKSRCLLQGKTDCSQKGKCE